jgi:hypothetical protein
MDESRSGAASASSCDQLVPFPFKLEANAAKKLVASGTLKAAKIGRRWYARNSDVLALVDVLAKPRAVAPLPAQSYADLVAQAKGGAR